MELAKVKHPESVHYEAVGDFSKSIFSDVYQNALKIVQNIVDGNLRLKQREAGEIDGTEMRNSEQIYNIVSFVGGRGTGKTSAMLSIMEHLKDHYRLVANGVGKKEDEQKYILKNCEQIMFTGLEYIDSSLLENKEDIFGIVLSKMLDKLRFEEKRSQFYGKGIVQGSDYEYKKRQLNLQFSNVYECLRDLRSKKDITDSASDMYLDTIQKLSMSWNLKSAFQELVNQYLQVMRYPSINGGGYSASFLIVSIDDIDLNIPNGFQMLEQIRKYLMLPNVIILLSLDYQQMVEICQEHYLHDFEASVKVRQNGAYIKKLAQDYLEKIIPDHRQVLMPSIYELDNVKIEQHDSVKDYVLQSIAKAVHLYFYNKTQKHHFLEPDTLRRLNLFAYEIDMMLEESDENFKAKNWYIDEEKYQWFTKEYLYPKFMHRLTEESQELMDSIRRMDMAEQIINICLFLYNAKPGIYERCIHGEFDNKRTDSIKLGELLAVLTEFKKYREYIPFTEFVLSYLTAAITRDTGLIRLQRNPIIADKMVDYIGQSIYGIWDEFVLPLALKTDSANQFKGLCRCGRISDIRLDEILKVLMNDNIDFQSKESVLQFINKYKKEIVNFQYLLLFINENKSNRNIEFVLGKDSGNMHDTNPGTIIKMKKAKGDFGISNFIFSLFSENNILTKFDEFLVDKFFNLSFYEKLSKKEKESIDDLRIVPILNEWKEQYSYAPVIPFYNLEFMVVLQQHLIHELVKYELVLSKKESVQIVLHQYFRVILEELEELDAFYKGIMKEGYYKDIYISNPLIKKMLYTSKEEQAEFYRVFSDFLNSVATIDQSI